MYILNQFIHIFRHQVLAYLKPHNKFYEDISIVKGLSSKSMLKFSDIVEIQGQYKNVIDKFILRKSTKWK